MGNFPPCLIGMDACGSAHDWARKLQGFGHTVRLMSPQCVKPYGNDAADAEAIYEAVTRPNMRFVPIKSVDQQAVLSMHRVRQGFVTARTAQANQIRGWASSHGNTPTVANQHSWASARVETYLRTLLIHGARAAILAATRHAKSNPWLSHVLGRRNPNIVAVALANKNARTAWALLAHDREFRADDAPRFANA